MRDPGRVAAAISVLRRFAERPAPLNILMKDWERSARYAGSKDRAFVRGLCLDSLRVWASHRGREDARLGVFLTLRETWGWGTERIEEAFSGEHGDGALTDEERESQPCDALDLPEFLSDLPQAAEIARSMAHRAPVDLRANTLKADQDKVLKALSTLKADAAPLSPIGLRIPPHPSHEKGPGVTVIPAFGKGWVEVQDEGSQLTVLACGDVRGKQVLDYCAGAGGKSLAFAAQMQNTGQVFAHDIDAGRLAPIHERLRRSGARNVQVVAPSDPERLTALEGQMDLVFADAPCSGSGTWRRHPDTKWRLTEEHLAQRLEEQDQVLRQAARFVKPGGELVFVTCSFLRAENDERVEKFMAEATDFSVISALDDVPPEVAEKLEQFMDGEALRLAPWSSQTDAFTLLKLRRRSL